LNNFFPAKLLSVKEIRLSLIGQAGLRQCRENQNQGPHDQHQLIFQYSQYDQGAVRMVAEKYLLHPVGFCNETGATIRSIAESIFCIGDI
jgi:hypothetical protein